jgi:hypothetical protein
MVSPFGWITAGAQPRLLAGLTVLLAGLSVWLWYLGRDLVTPEAPHGIVSYELARNPDRAATIIGSWSPRARAGAMLIQGLDYLYLFVYPAWLSLAAARLGAQVGGGWRRAGSAVSWIVLGAAPLDAVENHALIRQLVHGPSQLDAQLAWWCAVPKFTLVAFAGAFLVLTGCAWLLARSRVA